MNKFFRIFLASCFVIYFIVFSDVLSLCLNVFSCIEVGDATYNMSRRYMFFDLGIDCNSADYDLWLFKVILPLFLCYCFLIPVFMLVYLQRELSKCKNDDETQFKLKFKCASVYYAYKDKLFYWDFVILLRKTLILFIINYFFRDISKSAKVYPLLLICAILLFFFLIQIKLKPFNNFFKILNKLDNLSLISLMLTYYLCFIYLNNDFIPNDQFIYFFLSAAGLINGIFLFEWLKYFFVFKIKLKLSVFEQSKLVKKCYAKLLSYFKKSHEKMLTSSSRGSLRKSTYLKVASILDRRLMRISREEMCIMIWSRS